MWECENCKADVEDNFDVCWNCGSDKKGVSLSYIDTGEQVVFNEADEYVDKDNSTDFNIDIKSLEASRKLRFMNSLIDTFLIFVIPLYSFGDSGLIFLPFIFFFYYFLLESTIGVTIGKMITRTRVVNCLGEKPHFFTIFVRTICRFIPLDALTFGTPGGGWHDNFSSTFVISNKLSQI